MNDKRKVFLFMKTYTEFQNEILNKMTLMMGENYEVSIREVPKNNGVKLMGLCIMEKDSEICPNIYLEEFYEAYLSGREISAIIEDLYRFYKKFAVKGSLNFDLLFDYNRVKKRIFLKMINYEKNREQLAQVPHIRFLDLAIVCYMVCMNDLMGQGAVRVDDCFLEKWKITKEELFANAEENTKNLMGMELKDIQEMIFDILLQKWNPTTPEEMQLLEKEVYGLTSAVPMYIMTLRGGSFGAVCMFMGEWMELFYRKCGCGFYILPSSVHELLLIPENCGETAENLKKMVGEVNESCVSTEEKLSDSVYFYDPQKKKVELAE